VFQVARQASDDNLHVVAQVFGEQGAKGTVNQAADENCAIGGAALAAKVRARDFARRVKALFVIHAEREKVNARSRLVGHRRRAQQKRIARSYGDGTARLIGQLAGLEGDFLRADGGLENSTR